MKPVSGSSGQSLLETALVLPLLLVILIVFLELGRIVYIRSALNNAVREAARYATVLVVRPGSPKDCPLGISGGAAKTDIRDRVVDMAFAVPLKSSDVEVWCDPGGTTNLPCNEYVTVSAHIVVPPMVPLMLSLFGGGVNYPVDAESTMQMTPYGRQCTQPPP